MSWEDNMPLLIPSHATSGGRIPVRCPKCSSDTMIPVDFRFLWNLFNVKVRGRKVRPARFGKQLLFCVRCRKCYTMYDL